MKSVLLCLLALSTACDGGPYPRIGAPNDPLGALSGDVVTALRPAGSDGLDILVIGRIDEESGEGPFRRVTMVGNATETVAGSWSLSGEEVELQLDVRWTRPDESDLPPTQTGGTQVEEIDEQSSHTLTYESGLLEFDGEPYQPMPDMMAAITPGDREAALDAFAVYALTLEVGYGRVLGFGGPGMTQYFGNPTSFVGLVAGEQVVSLDKPLSPVNRFDYLAFQELVGFEVDGRQVTETNVSGSEGFMWGTVDFQWMPPGDEQVEVLDAHGWSGSVFYGNSDGSDAVRIDGGDPASGTYGVTLQGRTFQMSVDELDWQRVRDLIDLQPSDTGDP